MHYIKSNYTSNFLKNEIMQFNSTPMMLNFRIVMLFILKRDSLHYFI
jgi:hypothetical protein